MYHIKRLFSTIALQKFSFNSYSAQYLIDIRKSNFRVIIILTFMNFS